MKVLYVLLAMLILTSCSLHFIFTLNTDDGSNSFHNKSLMQDDVLQIESDVENHINVKYVKLGKGDMYVQESILGCATPDFLNEEQQQLYLYALSLYPIFNGAPMLIGSYPLQDGSYPVPDKMGTETLEIEGLRYLRVFGRFSKWSDFKEMMLSVYTKEYFPIISNNCIEHNGNTYILDSAVGIPFYTNQKKAPDTFELIKRNDSEIVFFRYQYFFEADNEDPIFGMKYTIVFKKVTDMWYVSLFKKDYEIEIE